MNSFSIIIVTWNGLHHLKTFLPSVINTQYPDFEIIIADNNSTDGTREWLKMNHASIKVASFDDNYGYTGGNNRAVPYSTKEYLIFLNNDVLVDPDWLQGISNSFDLMPQLAIVQPKIRSYTEPNLFEYAGAAGGFLDTFGYPFCRGRIMDHVEADNGQYDQGMEITWASGAAFGIKKSVFEELAGFDEDFEFHMEEIDLCWRAKNANYRVYFTPESTVYHLGGGSLPMGSSRKVYYNFRNSLFVLWKNLPLSQLWYKFLLRLVLDGVAGLRSIFLGNYKEFLVIIKAHIHFYKHFYRINKKRKSIKNKSKNVLQPTSLIWEYFIKRKNKFHDIMG